MRNNKIIFCGFIGTVLLGGAASAATIQIASKDYVDRRESAVLSRVSQTYATSEDVDNVSQQVTNLSDTINNEDTGLAAQIANAVSVAGAAQTAATDAKETADTVNTNLALKENVVNKVQTIEDNTTTYPSSAAVYDALAAKADTGSLAAVATTGSYDDLTDKPVIPAAITVDATLSADSENPVQNKVINAALATKADTTTVDELQTAVGVLETVVGDEEAGLVADVATASDAAGSAQSAVSALESVVNNAETGLATRASQTDLNALSQRVTTNETNIGTMDALTTTAKNLVGAINEVKTKTEGLPTEGNFEQISQQVGSLQVEVNNKADKATSLSGYGIEDAYTKTETDNRITYLAIPRPDGACTAASGLCVLSVTPDGTLKWENVTAPAQ